MRLLRLIALASGAAATVSSDIVRKQQEDGAGDDGEENGTERDPFRRRGMQQVIGMGDYIYLVGGEISNYYNGEKEDDDAYPSVTLNSTMAIDVSKSWTNQSVEFLYTQHDEPGPVNKFALWYDPELEKLYRWGGSTARGADMEEDDVKLWKFEADGDGTGTWGVQEPFDEELFNEIFATMGGAPASCGGKGYYIGGLGRSSTDPAFDDVGQDGIPVPGMLSYNFERRQWRNDSTVPMNPGYGEIVNANAHCATKLGGGQWMEGGSIDGGDLVFLVGGARTARDNASNSMPNSMTNITFWDPENERWLAQRTSGEAPNAREHFCVAGARGEDSYEIFVYGGENPRTGSAGSIHILSIPAFRWFKTDVSSPGRMHHSCTVAGKRQMISSGGVRSEWNWEERDPWRHSLGVFDMTALEWRSEFNPDLGDYETPQMVKDWYDENPSWSLEMDWDDSAVGELLTGGDDGEDTNPKDDSNQPSPSTPTGAIAGAVVGGIVGLAVVGGLVIFFVRRRRRRRQRGEAIELDSPSSTLQHPPEYKATDVAGSSSASTHVGGAAYKPSPANSDPYASPFSTQGATMDSSKQAQAPVEMPTTEMSSPVLELPTAGHERVEMEDNSRRELVG